MNFSHRVVAFLAVGISVACGGVPERSAPGAGRPAGSSPGAGRPAALPRPALEVPAGTSLHLTLDSTVSSKTSQVGDQVLARLSSDLVVDKETVARAGSAVSGQVTVAVPAGRVKTRARLAFTFDTLTLGDGPGQAIETRALDITAKDSHKQDALIIAGGAGAGGLIGAIADGKEGAGIGALIGAGAGTGVVLVDKGNNVVVPAGAAIAVELTTALRIKM